MHYLRCIHPPAGATALAAALGNETVKAMGFGFVAAPLMLNVLIILAWRSPSTAVSLAPLPGRPGAPQSEPGARPTAGYEAISHEDFVYALSQLDSFIDVSEEDLLRIYALATGRHRDLLAQAAALGISPSAPS
jgi:CBS domain-containing membrane protein